MDQDGWLGFERWFQRGTATNLADSFGVIGMGNGVSI